MIYVPANMGLLLAAILFLLGLIGVLTRRNVLFILMSLEIMLNAAGLAFVVAGAHWMQADGQVMFIFILTMAAAEVSVGLALILQMHRHHKTVDTNVLNLLKD
ncbi:MAG: NADH-quinone oxidoreductase subunit NuoK [Chitinophagales bacterium]|nr:NADH-quinone oxidoreductase subunit NuoK [Chitinophagales bacterium]